MKHKMSLWLFTILFFVACGQRNNSEGTSAEGNDPGPVTEADKQRYNLNNSDVMNYGTLDSADVDTIPTDSAEERQ